MQHLDCSDPSAPIPDALERALRLAAKQLAASWALWVPCTADYANPISEPLIRCVLGPDGGVKTEHLDMHPLSPDLQSLARAMSSHRFDARHLTEANPQIFDRVLQWVPQPRAERPHPTAQPPIQQELWGSQAGLHRLAEHFARCDGHASANDLCGLAAAGAWRDGVLTGLLVVAMAEPSSGRGEAAVRASALADLLEQAANLGQLARRAQPSSAGPAPTFQASESFYRSITATMSDGLLVVMNDGRIAAANPAASLILGAGQKELIGHDAMRHFVCLDDRLRALPAEKSPIRLIMSGRQGRIQRQSALRRLDQQVRWVDFHAQPLSLDDNGLPVSMLLTFRDITRQREAEQSLAVSQTRAEMALRGSGQGVWDWHADGSIYLSRSWKEMLGYQDHEIAGEAQDWFAHVHPEDLENVRHHIREHLRGHSELFEVEYRLRHRQGHTLYVLDRGRVVSRNRDGRADRMAGTVTDVSQLRRAERERREQAAAELASRAKTEFLSRMSHEMRTPLNAVIGFSQVLLDPLTPLKPEQVRERARHILRAGEHLLALVNDVLDLQKVEQGQLRMGIQAVRVEPVLKQVVDMLTTAAQDQGVWLREATDETGHGDGLQGAWISADERYLIQVLLNLVSNAIKYNRPGGQVSLTVQPLPHHTVILIQDTGWGMDGEQLQRLFQPFERLGKETSGIQGSGLGLLISRQLLHAMHGSLEVQSQLGRGTTMRLTLPNAPAPLQPIAVQTDGCQGQQPSEESGATPPSRSFLGGECEGTPAPQAPSGSGPQVAARLPRLKVLYVEDNPINTLLFEHTLGVHPGVELRCAEHGPQALELVDEWTPDLLVLDSHLPGMDGFELLEHLRSLPGLAQAPAFMCSADAMPDDVARAEEAGFTGYWAKPIRIEQILHDLSPWLHGRPQLPHSVITAPYFPHSAGPEPATAEDSLQCPQPGSSAALNAAPLCPDPELARTARLLRGLPLEQADEVATPKP
jgi:PAS domain S-box-containing protein